MDENEAALKRFQQAVEDAKRLKKELQRQISDLSRLIKKSRSLRKPNGKNAEK